MFNLKLIRRVSVIRSHASGTNDWSRQKIEKCHASTNMGKLRTTPIMMAAVSSFDSGLWFTEIQAAGIAFHRANILQSE
jgi:hypothetical protein